MSTKALLKVFGMKNSNSKFVCWALFDSETGDYQATVHKYFEDEIEIFGIGLSHYGGGGVRHTT